MKQVKFFSSIIIITFFFQVTYSQQPGFRKVMEAEMKLESLFTSLYDENSMDKDSLNDEIIQIFHGILDTWDGFYYKWPDLNKIGIVESEDNRLKVYTWYLQNSPDDFKYFGFIQYKSGKRKRKYRLHLHSLNDYSGEMSSPQTAQTSADRWFGCLYYGVQQFSDRNDFYYTLLGYDFNDQLSTIKLIEILRFNKDGDPLFGGKIHANDQIFARLFNQYSSELLVTQKYDPKLNMIVFDHLEPFQPIFEGNYNFYGPVGSYDGLRFENGDFFLEEDIDARNF